MSKENISHEMDESLKYADLAGFKEQVDKLFTKYTQKEVSEFIGEFIYKRYTTYKADSMARLLEIVIAKDPNIININHPDNPFFKLSVIKGSLELYNCFMEVGLQPFLKDKDEDFAFDYLTELELVARELNDTFFPQYVKCIKGMDFNGAIRQDAYSNQLSINIEDYEILDDVVEKYNTIIGRRDIIADLEERS